MIRIDGTLECEWCYSDALWGVDTPRGHRDLCQRHYDSFVSERDHRTYEGVSEGMLELLREMAREDRGMVTA